MDKTIIQAIHENDIEKILHDLKIFDDVQNGKFKCSVCNELMNINNIGSIRSKGGSIILCCSQIDCIQSIGGS